MSISSLPGVFDLLPEDPKESWRSIYLWEYVETLIRETARCYGYCEIRTPLLERTELFQRGIGEASDIVSKEMYTFKDRGDRSVTLRPEGTASVIRAFVEHHLHNESTIHKFFYIAPMFRYDRPQAGRYRQHHQFGVEAIGNGSADQDVEVIDLLCTLYRRLGLKNLKVYLNSIGDESSRLAFRVALLDYLSPRAVELSEDSQRRLLLNPLRILDSKDPQDQAIAKGAPSILDFLTDECRDHFEQVKSLLDGIGIPYEVAPTLVRGLDYYSKTVFEIVSGELGAQSSVAGGGRYDSLIKTLGGPHLPAIGFGAGIERMIQAMIAQQVAPPPPVRISLFLIPLGEQAHAKAFLLLHLLREKGIAAQMDFSGRKVAKALQYASRIGTRFIMVIGDDELASGFAELKRMENGEKIKASLSDLTSLANMLE